jgi:hypothetical protein
MYKIVRLNASNSCSNYYAETIQALLLGSCSSSTNPDKKCRKADALAIYDNNGNYVKTIYNPSVTWVQVGSDYYVDLMFTDNSSDSYNAYYVKLYGRNMNDPQQSSSYYELVKLQMSSGVSKAGTDTLKIHVSIGFPVFNSSSPSSRMMWTFVFPLQNLLRDGYDIYNTPFSQWKFTDSSINILATFTASGRTAVSGTYPSTSYPYLGVKFQDTVNVTNNYTVYGLMLDYQNNGGYAIYWLGGQSVASGSRTLSMTIVQVYYYNGTQGFSSTY